MGRCSAGEYASASISTVVGRRRSCSLTPSTGRLPTASSVMRTITRSTAIGRKCAPPRSPSGSGRTSIMKELVPGSGESERTLTRGGSVPHSEAVARSACTHSTACMKRACTTALRTGLARAAGSSKLRLARGESCIVERARLGRIAVEKAARL